MQKIDRHSQGVDSGNAVAEQAAFSSSGRKIIDHFRSAVEKATNFLSTFTSNIAHRGAHLSEVRELVSKTSPYLRATPEGAIYYTQELRSAASTIQRALYDIPRSRGIKDFEDRIMPHRQFIDETIWEAVTGKNIKDLVQTYFQEKGVHCHTREALELESQYFVDVIANGDISRFSTLLMWCLKDDPKIVDKLLSRLG